MCLNTSHNRNRSEEKRRMGRIVVTEFISLDGVVEDPGGAEDFKYGGWSFEFSRGDEGDKFKLDEALNADALLLARVTYQGLADASTLREPEWNNSTVLAGDLGQAVDELRRKHDGDIVVHGSAQLVQELLERDLVDELRLMVFPVVLGSGKRLFGATSDRKPLRLTEAKTVGDGVEILIFEPAHS